MYVSTAIDGSAHAQRRACTHHARSSRKPATRAIAVWSGLEVARRLNLRSTGVTCRVSSAQEVSADVSNFDLVGGAAHNDSSAGGEVDEGELVAELRACDTLEDILEVIADEATLMTGQDAAVALYRLAYLAKEAPSDVRALLMEGQAVKALLAVVIRTSADMTSQQISNCLWAMAKLEAAVKPVLVALCFRWNSAHLSTATLLDNAQFFWGLGCLGYVPDSAFLKRLVARLCEQIERIDEVDDAAERCLSMVAMGMRRVGGGLSQPLGAAITQVVKAHIRSMGGRAIANTVHSLAETVGADGWLLSAAAKRVQQSPDAFQLQEAGMVLTACCRNNYNPGELTSLVYRRVLAERDTATANDVSHLFWCFGRLGSVPKDADVPELLAMFVDKLPTANLPSVTNILWALATLGLLGNDAAQPIREHFLHRLEDEGERAKLRSKQRQIFHTHIMARHAGVDFPLPADLSTAAAADWIQRLHNSKAVLEQQRVSQVLSALKVPHTPHQPSEDGLLRIHLAVPRSGQAPLAVMIGGFADYIRGEGGTAEAGPTRMEAEMLKARGWEVVRLPAKALKPMNKVALAELMFKFLNDNGVPVTPAALEGGIQELKMDKTQRRQARFQQRRADYDAHIARGVAAKQEMLRRVEELDDEDTRPLSARRRPQRPVTRDGDGDEFMALPVGYGGAESAQRRENLSKQGASAGNYDREPFTRAARQGGSPTRSPAASIPQSPTDEDVNRMWSATIGMEGAHAEAPFAEASQGDLGVSSVSNGADEADEETSSGTFKTGHIHAEGSTGQRKATAKAELKDVRKLAARGSLPSGLRVRKASSSTDERPPVDIIMG